MKKMLFLFAPKFKEFGVDVTKKLIKEVPGLSIGGVCTGGQPVVSYIEDHLKEDILFADNIAFLEKEWLAIPNSEIDYSYLAQIDKKYGSGTVGEVITADRRVGLGFVRGGVTRPDEIGDLSLKRPVEATQKYIQGLFKYLEALFNKHQFDGVFCYAVAGGPAVAMALICKARGITFSRFNVTRIGDGFIIDTDYKGRLQPIAERFKSNEILDSKVLEKAALYLKNYRYKPVNPGYMDYNHRILKKNKLVPLSKDLMRYSVAYSVKALLPKEYQNRISYVGLKRKVFDWRLEWRKLRFDYSVFNQAAPAGRFFYYPLHVDPEASTMVVSPMHTDQVSVIEAISKSLPGDTTLVVKEHLPMVGKRHKSFYEQIKNMPRVQLVSPNLNAHDLIRSSEGVIVITGTAAFEAVLLGKKAVVIGDSPYLAINSGMIHEPCLNRLPKAIADLNELPLAEDQLLIQYIACAIDESFEMKSSVLWGDYYSHSTEELQSVIESVSSKIRDLIASEKS